MIWAPSSATVAILTSATAFVPSGNPTAGGLARIVNTTTDTVITFTLGGSTVTNAIAIPLTPGQDIIHGFGPATTHAIASAAGLSITPGAVWQ